jgi:hypothetical protein
LRVDDFLNERNKVISDKALLAFIYIFGVWMLLLSFVCVYQIWVAWGNVRTSNKLNLALVLFFFMFLFVIGMFLCFYVFFFFFFFFLFVVCVCFCLFFFVFCFFGEPALLFSISIFSSFFKKCTHLFILISFSLFLCSARPVFAHIAKRSFREPRRGKIFLI